MNPTTTDSEPTTAVAYCRSASGDPEDHGIANQFDRCQQLAAELDTTISRQFVDIGQSGNTADRPALRTLLDYVTTNPVTYVITSNPTRLARSIELQIQLEQQLLEQGCTVIVSDYDRLTATGVGVAAGNLPVAWNRDNEPPKGILQGEITLKRFEFVDRVVQPEPHRLIQLLHLRLRQIRDMKLLQRFAQQHRHHQGVLLPRSQLLKVRPGHSRNIVSRNQFSTKTEERQAIRAGVTR